MTESVHPAEPPESDSEGERVAAGRQRRRLVDNAMLAFLVFAGGLALLIPGGLDEVFSRTPALAPVSAMGADSSVTTPSTNHAASAKADGAGN